MNNIETWFPINEAQDGLWCWWQTKGPYTDGKAWWRGIHLESSPAGEFGDEGWLHHFFMDGRTFTVWEVHEMLHLMDQGGTRQWRYVKDGKVIGDLHGMMVPTEIE